MSPVESRRCPLFLRSLWHWDLFIVIAVGSGIGIVLLLTDLRLPWGGSATLAVLSLNTIWYVWHRWDSLQSKIESSTYYGELLRMTDQTKDEARMPFILTLCIAAISLLINMITAVIVANTTSWWVDIFVFGSVFLAAWMFIAVISLLRISIQHERLMDRVKEMEEKSRANERTYRTNKYRQTSTGK